MNSPLRSGLLLTAILSTSLSAQVMCGDCNANGSGPDILDSLTAAQITAGISTPSMTQLCACDVNSSGTLTIIDALLIAQEAAGLPVTILCPTPTCMAGACTTVTCGGSVAGLTGPGTGMGLMGTFTPGLAGDSQAFLLDVSGRTAGQYVFVTMENLSDDCDLYVTNPGTTCGDPNGAPWRFCDGSGLTNLADEFHSFDDATCSAFGNMIPIWVHHFASAPTATFTVRVRCVSDPCPAGTVDRLILDVDAPFFIFDDTTGADDTAAIGCGAGADPGGSDRVYLFRPATTTTYSFATCLTMPFFRTHMDTMIAIRQATCTTGTEIACNDDSTGLCPGSAPWYLSEMPNVPLTAGTDYYIIVDGWGGATGTFVLEVLSP